MPIEIPERRISRTSSANTMDDVVSEKPNEALNSELEQSELEQSELEQSELEHNELERNELEHRELEHIPDVIDNTNTVQDSSGESFASAVEHPLPSINEQNPSNTEDEALKNIENGAATNKVTDEIESAANIAAETKTQTQTIDMDLVELTQLTHIHPVSPQSLNDIVNTFMSNENAVASKEILETIKRNNELVSTKNINDKQKPEDLTITDAKLRDTLDDDISLQLFVDGKSVMYINIP